MTSNSLSVTSSTGSSVTMFLLSQTIAHQNCSSDFNCNATLNQLINEFDNNPYAAFRDQSRFWIQRVLVPIIMVIGVIGNGITIVIMTRRRMKSSTNSYLAALATFDMLYLICTFVLSIKYYPNIENTRYYYYWYFWPYFVMICDGASNTSIWLTVTFTIERYIAVCHPIKGKVLCTESRAKRVILCVFIICFTFTIPTPFEWIVVERIDPELNQTHLETTFSQLGQNDLYKTVYYYLTVILFILVPFLLLAIFNLFLIRSVHLSRKQRRLMTRGHSGSKPTDEQMSQDQVGSKQESRITIMLIAVVILFLLCQLPTACVLLYTAFHNIEPTSNQGLLIRGFGNIFNFLMAINAAGNFVLYCLLSQKYRRTFIQIFCPCFRSRFKPFQSAYQNTIQTNLLHQQLHNHNNNFGQKNCLTFNYNNLTPIQNRICKSDQRLSVGNVNSYLDHPKLTMKYSKSENVLDADVILNQQQN